MLACLALAASLTIATPTPASAIGNGVTDRTADFFDCVQREAAKALPLRPPHPDVTKCEQQARAIPSGCEPHASGAGQGSLSKGLWDGDQQRIIIPTTGLVIIATYYDVFWTNGAYFDYSGC